MGEEENEYLAVKLETFDPPLVVFSYYGQQENQHPMEKITGHVAEVLEKAERYSDERCDVVISGDFNLKIGNDRSGLGRNEATVSRGGRFLLEALEATGAVAEERETRFFDLDRLLLENCKLQAEWYYSLHY